MEDLASRAAHDIALGVAQKCKVTQAFWENGSARVKISERPPTDAVSLFRSEREQPEPSVDTGVALDVPLAAVGDVLRASELHPERGEQLGEGYRAVLDVVIFPLLQLDEAVYCPLAAVVRVQAGVG